MQIWRVCTGHYGIYFMINVLRNSTCVNNINRLSALLSIMYMAI